MGIRIIIIIVFSVFVYTSSVEALVLNSTEVYFENEDLSNDLNDIAADAEPTTIIYEESETLVGLIPEIDGPVITRINLDEATVKKGYTVYSENKAFLLAFNAGILSESTPIVIKNFAKNNFDFGDSFKGLEALSDVYEFDVLNSGSLNNHLPFILQVQNPTTALSNRSIYFYNGVSLAWEKIPSTPYNNDNTRSYIHLPYAKIVVAQEKVMSIGDASWYAYKDCLCAASPDYAKGTKLLVEDLDTGKSVEVVVNDWGPERDIFPNRVIDLDKLAFLELGKLSWGVLKNIKVTPISPIDVITN